MRVKFLPVFLVMLLIPARIVFAAEEIKVSTVFDKKTLEVNDQLNLTIKIVGSRVNVQRPRIPVNESFDSFYSGRASRFSLINGVQESVTEFRYVLVPKRPGVFKVGPIEIQVNDSTYRTDPVEIEVLGTPGTTAMSGGGAPTFPSAQAPSQAPPPPGPSYAPSPYVQRAPSPVVQPGESDTIFLRAWVDKTNVYPGEQILLTYSIYTRADTRYEGFEQEPEATGFWIEELPIGQNVDRSTVSIGGRKYIKADIRKMALFATAPGEFTLQPGSVKASIEERARESGMFDDFFNDSFFGGGGGLFARRVNKILTAAPVTIHVKELPQRGKPSEFSGTVGRFTFNSSIDKKEVKQNEPVTMTLKIEGEGNIETLQHPPVPDIENFKVYEGESSSQLFKRGSTIVGSKDFEIIFIPEKAGAYSLPSLLFNYFDPIEQRYKAERTPEYQIKVLPGEASEELKAMPFLKSEALKKEITEEAKDIYSIKTNLRLTFELAKETKVRNILSWTNGALGLGFFLFFLARMRTAAYERDKARYRRKNAAKAARKRLKKLERSITKASGKADRQFYVEAAKIFDQYFADKFNVSPQGLTFSEIENQMLRHEMDPVLQEEVRSFYETADLARFTGLEPAPERLPEMLSVIERVVAEIEKRK